MEAKEVTYTIQNSKLRIENAQLRQYVKTLEDAARQVVKEYTRIFPAVSGKPSGWETIIPETNQQAAGKEITEIYAGHPAR